MKKLYLAFFVTISCFLFLSACHALHTVDENCNLFVWTSVCEDFYRDQCEMDPGGGACKRLDEKGLREYGGPPELEAEPLEVIVEPEEKQKEERTMTDIYAFVELLKSSLENAEYGVLSDLIGPSLHTTEWITLCETGESNKYNHDEAVDLIKELVRSPGQIWVDEESLGGEDDSYTIWSEGWPFKFAALHIKKDDGRFYWTYMAIHSHGHRFVCSKCSLKILFPNEGDVINVNNVDARWTEVPGIVYYDVVILPLTDTDGFPGTASQSNVTSYHLDNSLMLKKARGTYELCVWAMVGDSRCAGSISNNPPPYGEEGAYDCIEITLTGD